MSLGLYKIPDASGLYTSTSPFTVTFDGRVGGILDKRVYLRNNDPVLWYSNISVKAVDIIEGTGPDNIVDNSKQDFYWKLAVKDIPLTNEEWTLVDHGNTLSLPNLGNSTTSDIVTFLSFWVRVSIPRGQKIQTIKHIEFQIDATENILD